MLRFNQFTGDLNIVVHDRSGLATNGLALQCIYIGTVNLLADLDVFNCHVAIPNLIGLDHVDVILHTRVADNLVQLACAFRSCNLFLGIELLVFRHRVHHLNARYKWLVSIQAIVPGEPRNFSGFHVSHRKPVA